jgi:hypothetical protein
MGADSATKTSSYIYVLEGRERALLQAMLRKTSLGISFSGALRCVLVSYFSYLKVLVYAVPGCLVGAVV